MSAASIGAPHGQPQWTLPSKGYVAMWGLITAESAIFSIFVIAYLFYAGKSLPGSQPVTVLHPPLFLTFCLLSSSLTIHVAVAHLEKARVAAFRAWWILTILLGAIFLGGTALEWRRLIFSDGLTIQANLFGTTYYSLVGLHAFHVTVGLVALTSCAIFAILGYVGREHAERMGVLALYWHFVDAVWVVVFTVVYVIKR